MTYPQAPAPAPATGPPPPPASGQAPVPQDQAQPPADSPPGGGESATDAAAGDPMAWLAAAELDARYGIVQRPLNGNVG